MDNIQLQWSVCGLCAMTVFSLFRIVVVLKVDQHFLDSWNKLICIFDTWDNCLESCILYYSIQLSKKCASKGWKIGREVYVTNLVIHIIPENVNVVTKPDVFLFLCFFCPIFWQVIMEKVPNIFFSQSIQSECICCACFQIVNKKLIFSNENVAQD